MSHKPGRQKIHYLTREDYDEAIDVFGVQRLYLCRFIITGDHQRRHPKNHSKNRIYLEYVWPGTGPTGIKLEPGHTYKVKVVLDYNVRISEVDRSNNVKTIIWGMTP